MSRVYATREDTGERIFLHLTCDGPGCDAILKPSPDVAASGWVSKGYRPAGSRDKIEIDLCPQHAAAQRS